MEPATSSSRRSRRWALGLLVLCGLPLLLLGWAWVAGSLAHFEHWPMGVGLAILAAWTLGSVLALRRFGAARALPGSIGLAAGWSLAFLALQQPRTDRPWTIDQERSVTMRISADGEWIEIENVRNFRWRSIDDFEPSWELRRHRLADLRSLDLVIEPLPALPGMAHVLLCFGFADADANTNTNTNTNSNSNADANADANTDAEADAEADANTNADAEHLAVSVEIRKERGESFSPLAGLFRRFELAYVVGDERDLLGLRLNARRHELIVHPLRAEPEQAARLLVSLLRRADELGRTPEFYNTLTSTCATNLLRHLEDLRGEPLPFDWRVHLPLHADALAWDLGLIDGVASLEEARRLHRVVGPVGESELSQHVRTGHRQGGR